MTKKLKVTLFIALLLIIDQIIKILVKTNMTLGESIKIFSWFQILFVENNGMAFGMEFGSKIILTLFRLIISGLVLYYIIKLVKSNYKIGYILCVCLIFAGAIGNIIDCLFYGVIFGESSFLQGRVVDMFYFPLFEFPSWVPFLSGEIFFSPIFNFADSCITVGIFLLILFFRKDFNKTFDNIFSKNKK
ncbi:MAG: lipoprotein signal peptidase [Prevotellaceae bacterium]|jgi:signal peptidase II|nr:lipoprotein signal peptidase [Prevotellaceae bacterium]